MLSCLMLFLATALTPSNAAPATAGNEAVQVASADCSCCTTCGTNCKCDAKAGKTCGAYCDCGNDSGTTEASATADSKKTSSCCSKTGTCQKCSGTCDKNGTCAKASGCACSKNATTACSSCSKCDCCKKGKCTCGKKGKCDCCKGKCTCKDCKCECCKKKCACGTACKGDCAKGGKCACGKKCDGKCGTACKGKCCAAAAQTKALDFDATWKTKSTVELQVGDSLKLVKPWTNDPGLFCGAEETMTVKTTDSETGDVLETTLQSPKFTDKSFDLYNWTAKRSGTAEIHFSRFGKEVGVITVTVK